MKTLALRAYSVLKPFLLIAGMMGVALAAIHFTSGVALAQTGTLVDGTVGAGLPGQIGGTGSLRELVLDIINFFLGFLALLAVIMIIYGGFLYVSSQGNQEEIDQAKKILIYAVIGIIVIVISFALVNTLLGGLSEGGDQGVS
jgi:hypothetical protein